LLFLHDVCYFPHDACSFPHDSCCFLMMLAVSS
jgi:hypothetical protein